MKGLNRLVWVRGLKEAEKSAPSGGLLALLQASQEELVQLERARSSHSHGSAPPRLALAAAGTSQYHILRDPTIRPSIVQGADAGLTMLLQATYSSSRAAYMAKRMGRVAPNEQGFGALGGLMGIDADASLQGTLSGTLGSSYAMATGLPPDPSASGSTSPRSVLMARKRAVKLASIPSGVRTETESLLDHMTAKTASALVTDIHANHAKAQHEQQQLEQSRQAALAAAEAKKQAEDEARARAGLDEPDGEQAASDASGGAGADDGPASGAGRDDPLDPISSGAAADNTTNAGRETAGSSKARGVSRAVSGLGVLSRLNEMAVTVVKASDLALAERNNRRKALATMVKEHKAKGEYDDAIAAQQEIDAID